MKKETTLSVLKEIRDLLKQTAPVSLPSEKDISKDYWSEFWSTYGITLGEYEIPEKKEGFDRLLVIPKGMTPAKMVEISKKEFGVYTWYDVNELKEVAKEDYAIWCKESVEPDVLNISANQAIEQGIDTLNLTEVLVYSLKYFKETGKHLDDIGWTICPRTILPSGRVAFSYWNRDNRQARLGGSSAGHRNDDCGVRTCIRG